MARIRSGVGEGVVVDGDVGGEWEKRFWVRKIEEAWGSVVVVVVEGEDEEMGAWWDEKRVVRRVKN